MSEQRDDAPERDDDAPEQDEGDESQTLPEGEGEDDGEDGDKPAPKPVDWEKRAHSHAGQAARERSRRQAAERRATDLETRLDRVERASGADRDELLDLIGQLRDDDEDPVGDIASVKQALKLLRQRELAADDENRQQSHFNRQIETLKSTMADAEADFATDHPDYKDAAAFYRKSRTEELEEAGYSGHELQRRLADDLFGMVKTAFTAGLDPAEKVYNLAKRHGFKAGQGAANKKLDAFDRSAASGVRPQARPAAGVLSWADVAKLEGSARDKAWDALRKRERARK